MTKVFTTSSRLQPPLSQSSKTPKLLGHRGAKAECLENSQQGFLRLQGLNVYQKSQRFENPNIYGVEFDVQLTADKQLVVFHDDNLSHIYAKQARVDELSYSELSKLSAGTYPILRLDKMWSMLQGFARIELEIKTHARSNIADIAKALRQYTPFAKLPITLTSFDVNLHAYIQRCPILNQYPRGLLIAPNHSDAKALHYATTHYATTHLNTDKDRILKRITLDAINLAARLDCNHLGFYYPLINAHTIKQCHQYGLSVSAWTVNKVSQVHSLTQLDVDYIITDYPTKMSSIF